MNLLPEDQAAAHLDPIMYAAHESGLPVPCSIPPHNVKRFILSDICMAEVLEIDHETIHDSYLLAKASGKSWGPWWIARLLMDKRAKEYDAHREAEREEAGKNITASQIARTMDMNREGEDARNRFEAFKQRLTPDGVRAIVDKWKRQLGDIRMPSSDVILQWEWNEREKA